MYASTRNYQNTGYRLLFFFNAAFKAKQIRFSAKLKMGPA